MTRRLLLALAVLAAWGLPARAQLLWPIGGSHSAGGDCPPAASAAPCPPGAGTGAGQVVEHPYRTQREPSQAPCGVPTLTALARLGLERQWVIDVPLMGDETLLGISLSEALLFARTDKGFLHVYDQETGRPVWTVRVGPVTSKFTPPAVNSYAIFVANLNELHCLDRATGRTIWVKLLDSLPSCPAAADEERVMVGFMSGKLYGFDLKVSEEGTRRIAERPNQAWVWQTVSKMETRPQPAGKFVAFGSADGKVYVAAADEPTMLYRIATGGPIGMGFGTHGTRILLAPSADRNLYAIDLFSSAVKWSYPSGAPIVQEPLVAQDDIYIVNTAGLLTSLDSETGSARWAISTQGGPLITVGTKRIYLKSVDQDLFIVDRQTGQMIAEPRATFERAGLNLRCFEYNPTNRFNDRLYFANTRGLMVAVREAGKLAPTHHRDPKSQPFGYIPPEGISLTPRPTPPPDTPVEPETPPPPRSEAPRGRAARLASRPGRVVGCEAVFRSPLEQGPVEAAAPCRRGLGGSSASASASGSAVTSDR